MKKLLIVQCLVISIFFLACNSTNKDSKDKMPSISTISIGKTDVPNVYKLSTDKNFTIHQDTLFYNGTHYSGFVFTLYNEKDTMKSTSSRIALGRVIAGGTGSFDLLLDTNKLENSEYTENESSRITFVQLEEETLIHDIMKYDVIIIKFFIPK